MTEKIRKTVLLLLSMGFLFSVYMAARDIAAARREERANRELAAMVRPVVPEKRDILPEGSEEREPETELMDIEGEAPLLSESGRLLKYEGLYSMNGDMAGWLSIEGTEIDYPVMFTPGDIEYYLHRGFDGEYAKSGSLFLGGGWSPESGLAIIYGHHMKNGAMFGALAGYTEESFFEEHRYISFDTLTEEREYEVAAVFLSRVYPENADGVFRYYGYTDLPDEDAFNEYVAGCMAAALYDTGVTPVYGERLLVLSTCSYHTREGRLVVLARETEKQR